MKTNKFAGRAALAFLGTVAFAGMASAQVVPLLFPFDRANPAAAGWTQSMNPNDDSSSSQIQLGFDFCFYQTDRSSLFINNNGNVTFDNTFGSFSSSAFPSASVPGMIAPFWADVDTRNRNLTGTGTNLVWHSIRDTNGDSAPDLIVVTWDDVGFFSGNNTRRNTFQLALSADENFWGPGLNAAFSYDDMDWTTGGASGGTGGFGGTPATVGINRGNGIDFSQLGRFGQTGNAYDGADGAADGVDFLDGRDLFFNACQGIVPSPSAAALLGVAGLAASRRRRTK